MATGSTSTSTSTSTWEEIDTVLGLSPAALGNSRAGSQHLKSHAERTVEVQRWRAMASAVLKVATDGVQRHISRLILVRREQSVMLRVSDMRRLWDVATSFTTSANSILSSASSAAALSLASSPESYVVLDECLAQVKGLLAALHSRNTATLSALLDAEQWKQAEVPRQVQRIADAIARAVSSVPQGGVGVGGGGDSASSVGAIQRAIEGEVVRGAAEGSSSVLFNAALDSAQTLTVGGVAYPLVNSAVMLVKMLGDYSNVTESFPDVAADAIACTVQLLRSFNSRSHALILEAKASALLGGPLKQITAKHLALTSQSLGAVLSLLPALRAHLLMRLAPHQHMLLSDLAAVTADLLAHDSKIKAKLVTIVRDLMAACCTRMRTIPWGNPNAAMTIPSTPMTEFISATSTLHGILMGIFRKEQVADVYSRILLMANSHLPGHYAVLIAHLATTAASAAAAAAQPHARAAHAADPHSKPASAAAAAASAAATAAAAAAAAAAPLPVFDRGVALQRMGADLRLLLEQFSSLLSEPKARDASAASSEHPTPAEAGMAASIADSREALKSLQQWVLKEFSGAVVAAGSGAGGGEGVGAASAPPRGEAAAAQPATVAAAVDTAAEAAETSTELEGVVDDDLEEEEEVEVPPTAAAAGKAVAAAGEEAAASPAEESPAAAAAAASPAESPQLD